MGAAESRTGEAWGARGGREGGGWGDVSGGGAARRRREGETYSFLQET